MGLAVIDGAHNLMTGGSWNQSGGEIATQNYNTAERIASQKWASAENALDRAFNAEQAQLQRDYEERLSNSAYTRAVADIRNAGLNPALMFGSANQASTPTGSSASHSGSAPTNSARSVHRSEGNGLETLALTALGLMKTVAGLAKPTPLKFGFGS